MTKAGEAARFRDWLAREKLISKTRRPPPVAELARAAKDEGFAVPASELAAVRALGGWAEPNLPYTQQFPSPLEAARKLQCVAYSEVAADLASSVQVGKADIRGVAILYDAKLPALLATPDLPGGWGWIAFRTDSIDPIALSLEDLAIHRWSGLSSFLDQSRTWPGSTSKERDRSVAKLLPKEPEGIALLRYAMERYGAALEAWKGCTSIRVVTRTPSRMRFGPETLAEACAVRAKALATLSRIVGAPPPETDQAAIASALRKLAAPFVYAAARKAKLGDAPTSVLGGNTWARPGETWPSEEGRPLQHLLTVRTDEAEVLPKALEGVALLEIFSSDEPSAEVRKTPTDGDSLVIRAYDSLKDLVPLRDPARPRAKGSALSWKESVDYPAPFVARDLLRARRVRAGADEIESVMDDEAFENHSGTKLGGWPTFVQQDVTTKGFALQLLEGPFGDAGTLYVHRVRGGWQGQWYCY